MTGTRKGAEKGAVTRSLKQQATIPYRDWANDTFRTRIARAWGPTREKQGTDHEVVLDPRRIPLDALRNLGLVPSIDETASVTRDRITALPELRAILRRADHLHPVLSNDRNFGDPRTGTVFVTRHDAHNGLTIATYTKGIYDVSRAKLYSKETERADRDMLGKHIEALEWVIENITTRWQDLDEAGRANLNTRLERAVADLETAVLAIKQKAHGKFDGSLGFRDSLDRENPMAIAQRIASGVRALRERMKQTITIDQFMSGDRRDVDAVITESEGRLKRFMRELKPIATTPLFAGAENDIDLHLATLSQAGGNRAALIRSIQTLRSHIEPLRTQPFLAYQTVLNDFLAQAQEILEGARDPRQPVSEKHGKAAEAALIQAWLACKHFLIQQAVEADRHAIACGTPIHPTDMRQKWAERRQYVVDYQVAPERELEAFRTSFVELTAFLDSIVTYFEPRHGSQRSKAEYKEILKSFDFQTAVTRLGTAQE